MGEELLSSFGKVDMKSGAEQALTIEHWYALQVRSRKESFIAAELEAKGFQCFLPKYTSVRRWSDRVKELEQPLFPGYLFCRFELAKRRPLLLTQGVVQIVGTGRLPAPLDDSEISSLQLAVASGLPRQPWPYLEAGSRVKLQHGNLAGLEGIFVNFKGNHRVVLSVTLLQRSVALEVDLSWVVAVPEERAVQPRNGEARPAIVAPVVG